MSTQTKQVPIETLAEDWLRLDRNPETRKTIDDLVKSKDEATLEKLLRKRIVFGTAGLRAGMEAGFSRMNDLTVIQASQGLCAYLSHVVPDAVGRGVVIGYDHRHHSRRFARLAAAAFLHRGFTVHYLDEYVHTPLVPYGVRQLDAACGIMITASHNPKQDNGYKVYWGNACQIIPPHDEGIASSILQHTIPWTWDEDMVDRDELVRRPLASLVASYMDDLGDLSYHRNLNAKCPIPLVYTAMHGVGTPYVEKAMKAFGLPAPIQVKEQCTPDPEFPTVPFPNPEEKGALDLAMKRAEEAVEGGKGRVLVLANDPDADRFAVAERQLDGSWRVLTGNQIGVLLAMGWVKDLRDSGKVQGKGLAMVASAVSSKMLESIAKAEGFHFEERLTGFKWIGNGAIELRHQGYTVPFAYEEAIGFMCGEIVPDKDGVSALARFAELASRLAQEGRGQGVWDYYEDLCDKYGHFHTGNSYFICHNATIIQKIFERIRYGEDSGDKSEFAFPKVIAGSNVVHVRDLTVGYDSATSDHQPTLPVSPGNGQMISFRLENGAAITLRTSGTEPKIKYYIEMQGKSEEEAARLLDQVVKGSLEELIQPERHGLA
ncbi:hypothetical protein BJ684DRAFT_22028 [Piptocephalis cylindrospora]|uniref:Phosphoglucomutase n=1 Tax=Piptocephalis cylindrospora TaxID=1907219 RepID=A0A4V1IXK8_9FUNG|nr:hypothetical protein BJ684DRAFT_22028 [Piptocephalis cylindrospora]|eukprot:RKP11409.1 hypothetical protein BJ684DRAFT_22028 [Piptocephalis cylindrospora]